MPHVIRSALSRNFEIKRNCGQIVGIVYHHGQSIHTAVDDMRTMRNSDFVIFGIDAFAAFIVRDSTLDANCRTFDDATNRLASNIASIAVNGHLVCD